MSGNLKKAAAAVVVEELATAVAEISAFSDFRNAYKKLFCNFARRLRLLAPMFEELGEAPDRIPSGELEGLERLCAALEDSRELLRLGSEGSKICLVLEKDIIMKRFQNTAAQLEQALGAITFDKLDISDEVKEQIELVRAQLHRATEQLEVPNDELWNDLSSLYNNTDSKLEPLVLQRLSEKLQLVTLSDLKQESVALHEMVVSRGGDDPGENIEKMSLLLKKIKDFLQNQNPELGSPPNSSVVSEKKTIAPTVPDDFRCPISLELMKDPVIVATGQTYDRSCIEKWLDAGHNTCPKTQQKLPHASLTPNYVLRSLIMQWCESNGIVPPQLPLQPGKPPSASACSSGDRAKIVTLLQKLTSTNLDDQQLATGELRLLAKRSNENRICIAEAGTIPILVDLLLSTHDARTQEHAVTSLLNLSICEENKGKIITSGAVPAIVQVLKTGSMEARENAAATLFSLSVVDENKVTIGALGAIPALVSLLNEGSHQGKKDAATALFNLCIYQGNKAKAVRAGVVPTLMVLLMDSARGMVDEALAILAILSGHPEGKAAIGAAEAVPLLVEVISSSSPRNRENAAAVLLHLCGGEQQRRRMAEAQECGAVAALEEMALNGTERGKRKAAQLLERMNRFLDQQTQAATEFEATSGAVQVE